MLCALHISMFSGVIERLSGAIHTNVVIFNLHMKVLFGKMRNTEQRLEAEYEY